MWFSTNFWQLVTSVHCQFFQNRMDGLNNKKNSIGQAHSFGALELARVKRSKKVIKNFAKKYSIP